MILQDFKDRNGKWVQTVKFGGRSHCTWSGSRWAGILARTNPKGAEQKKNKGYFGTINGFMNFQDFADWANSQKGHGLKNYQIDKDILVIGNKIYSRSTCLIVPQQINAVIVGCNHHKGDLPTGVVYNKRDKAYMAQLNKFGKHVTLGYYSTIEAAYFVFKEERNKYLDEIVSVYNNVLDDRCKVALLKNYKV